MTYIYKGYQDILSSLFFIVLFITSSGALASDNISGNNIHEELIIQKAIESKLYKDPQWLALLYYSKIDLFGLGYTKSEVDSQKYFLSPNGKTDPKAELIATIKALFTKNKDLDKSAVCLFPARLELLSGRFPRLKSMLPVRIKQCKKLAMWLENSKSLSGGATIVFASSYLGNAASMYGHTFLRLNRPNATINNSLLSIAVNFGAEVPQSSGSFDILYPIKGIFGGYKGRYSVMHYAKKLKEYNSLENRDLWEFQLNLNAKEAEFIRLHLWEMEQSYFDYYFFNENCSYRIVTLLKIVRPNLQIPKSYAIYTLPIDTLKFLSENNLISKVHYRPSTMKILEHKMKDLTSDEIYFVKNLRLQNILPDDKELMKLEPHRRSMVYEYAYQYLLFGESEGKYSALDTRTIGMPILIARSKIKEASEFTTIPTPQSPILSHNTGRITTQIGHKNIEYKDKNNKQNKGIKNKGSNFLDLSLRLAVHEPSDYPDGYLPNMSLIMGQFDMRFYDKNSTNKKSSTVELENVTYIKAVSLPAIHYPLFSKLSWKVNLKSARELYSIDDNPIVHQGIFNMGGAIENSSSTLFAYALAGFFANASSHLHNGFSLGLSITSGVVWHSFLGQSDFGYEYQKGEIGDLWGRQDFYFTHGYNFSTNFQLQLKYKHRENIGKLFKSNEGALGFNFYF